MGKESKLRRGNKGNIMNGSRGMKIRNRRQSGGEGRTGGEPMERGAGIA